MKTRIRIIILAAAVAAAVALIILGIYRDEVSVIFQNASNICLECIGLGR